MAFSLLPRPRLCHSPEPVVDEATAAAMAADPDLHGPLSHQRGRRRRRSPAPYSGVPFPLFTTAAAPADAMAAPMPYKPHRQHTPSGSSGTFRGRRRHRSPSSSSPTDYYGPSHSPSVSASSARAASRTASPSLDEQVPAGWQRHRARGSGSRGGSGSNSSPRRRILRATVELGDEGGHHGHKGRHPPRGHAPPRHRQPRALHHTHRRRSQSPSRFATAVGTKQQDGSFDGHHQYHYDQDAADSYAYDNSARLARRRQRTRSRPQHRAAAGEAASAAAAAATMTAGYGVFGAVHADTAVGKSRLQFQVLADAASDEGGADAMEVETG